MMPKVTVVIPAYNAMAFLPETLDSVLQQTFTDFEVSIVNDGSTDKIVAWFMTVKDDRVRLISQANQGLSGARNTGIAEARGEYIAFLDADDLWAATKLEQQVRCLDRDPAVGLVYTWTRLVDETGKPTGVKYDSQVEGNVWQQILVGDIICSGSSAMVRRDCFDRVGRFDPNLSSAADFDMWTRIAAQYPFAVVKEYLLDYRQHSSSMSRNHLKMMQDLRMTFEKRFQSVPLELLYLRNVAYAGMYRGLAWKCMYAGNYRQASDYSQQAILHDPAMRHTKIFRQLQLEILLSRWLEPATYLKFKTMIRKLRSPQKAASKLSPST
jgi:glycosyltransferase involved in cell wall biosynthesis